jgi:hypothetical protein
MDSNWQYFFDNQGRCPKCRNYLTPFGCMAESCIGVIEKKEVKNQFVEAPTMSYRMMYRAQKRMREYKVSFDEYWAYLMRRSMEVYLAKHIDNTDKKSYSKNI